MLVLAAGNVASSAVKQSKQRKQINYLQTVEKAKAQEEATQFLRQQKQETYKAIAKSYIETQQKQAALKKKKEMQKNIAIAVGAGVVLITIGVIAYKKTK